MDKETYQQQKGFAGDKKASMKRRFVGHDYTRPGIYMVTLAVEGRRPLFGSVCGSADAPRIELTALGEAVRDEWWGIPRHHPEVKVYELQMMPDHLHGILYVCEPFSGGLSRVIRGFKTGCGRAYRRLVAPSPSSLSVATQSQPTLKGTHPEPPSPPSSPSVATQSQPTLKGTHPEHGLLFEPGFNDLVLRTREEYQRWKHYLRDNPRRLLLKREKPGLLRPFFGLTVGRWTFNGIGNRALLTAPRRLAVRISRRLTAEQLEQQVEGYLQAAEAGAVLVSPAISPGEKRVMRTAFDRGLPTIVVVPNGFTPLSKPRGEQFDACAQGRLLMLSAWEHRNDRQTITAYQCQQMNLMAMAVSDSL